MNPRYQSHQAVTGDIQGYHGYEMKVPPGSWTVVDRSGYPLRTHDGFAVFASKQQADWAAELMGHAFAHGAEAAQGLIREALGIADG